MEEARNFKERGLAKKAKEYSEIAKELDPTIIDENGSASTLQGANNSDLVFRVPEFVPNPDRPYNSMVQSFYNEAVESYSNGDNLDAINYLTKAKKLDPVQPQVNEFLDKIQGPTEQPDDPLAKIREALKNGKNEEALAKLDDYLDQHPDDEEALELKDKIEGRAVTPKTKKKSSRKIKKLFAEKTPPTQSDKSLQAEADQAYNLGLDSYRQGDYAAAEKFWEQTLVLQPNHIQAQRNLERLKQEHADLK